MLQSLDRYALIIFPMFMGLAMAAKSEKTDTTIRFIFVILLGIMTALRGQLHHRRLLNDLEAANGDRKMAVVVAVRVVKRGLPRAAGVDLELERRSHVFGNVDFYRQPVIFN